MKRRWVIDKRITLDGKIREKHTEVLEGVLSHMIFNYSDKCPKKYKYTNWDTSCMIEKTLLSIKSTKDKISLSFKSADGDDMIESLRLNNLDNIDISILPNRVIIDNIPFMSNGIDIDIIALVYNRKFDDTYVYGSIDLYEDNIPIANIEFSRIPTWVLSSLRNILREANHRIELLFNTNIEG